MSTMDLHDNDCDGKIDEEVCELNADNGQGNEIINFSKTSKLCLCVIKTLHI